jgi:hypothetical protein
MSVRLERISRVSHRRRLITASRTVTYFSRKLAVSASGVGSTTTQFITDSAITEERNQSPRP